MKNNNNKKTETPIVLYVGRVTEKVFTAVAELEAMLDTKIKIALITSIKQDVDKKTTNRLDYLFKVNLHKESEIEDALYPIRDHIVLINCFSEYYLQAYGRILQLFPYLKGPNYRTIQLATHKLKMREAFKKYMPKNTPKFMLINDVSPNTIEKVEKYVRFPCIVKPVGLTRSQLVSICYYHEELEATLKEAYRKIKKLYKENKNENVPEILVEEVIEGKLFSVDVYVNSKGRCYFTPFIEIKTGKEKGHDDVYLYQQTLPSIAKQTDQEDMRKVIEMSIHALGLRSSTAHVEFFKTQTGYKLVEVGCRIGGFRHELLELSYGTNHYLNDMLIRMARVPIIKNKLKSHVSLIKFFPEKAGVLKKIKGFKKIIEEPYIRHVEQPYKPGAKVGLSKYGYKPVFQCMVIGENRAKLLGNLRKVEKTIKIELE